MSEYKIETSDTESREDRYVQLYLLEKLYLVRGNWPWNLHSPAVYCSDVMFTLPFHFDGTKGIIHPDDVEALYTSLNSGEKPTALQFRMITTYGKVEVLSCDGVVVSELEQPDDDLPFSMSRETVLAEKGCAQENEMLRSALSLSAMAEKNNGVGTWYFNTATYAIYFSDNLYRLHGLSPQGVNAHLKSFESFLHPDDAAAYWEAFDKAYQHRAPLHLTYRIVDALGNTKYLQLMTAWDFSEKGELLLRGMVTDETAYKLAERELEHHVGQNAFLKELIHLSENMTGIGTWHINLFTRKSVFSDNFYRIYGLKPQVAGLNLDLLVNFVHPDDRALVTGVNRQIIFEHTCPETEFRIVRNDGKTRYLHLKGKLMVHSKTDLVMVGTIKDMTAARVLEKKKILLSAELKAQKLVQQEVEATTDAYVWVTNLQTGKTEWSSNFYTLLGYRPNFVELTQKLFTNFIHLEDKKKFGDTLYLAVHEKTESSTHFRIIIKGAEVYLKVTFKPIEQEGTHLMAAIMQNVSQQTALQQQQHYLQQMLTALQGAVSEKVFVTDRGNTIVDMNEAALNSLVAKGQEVVHKNVFDVFPQLKEVDFMEQLQQVIGGKAANLPATVLAKSIRAGSYYLLPLPDENGAVQNVLHVVEDKTGEQRLHQKATLHIRLVESIIRLMPGRVIVMDKHMNYVYWNEKCEQHYGIKKEEVIGKNILEFSPGFYDDPGYNEFKKTLGGEVVYLTDRLRSINDLHAEAMLIPVADDKGSVEYILWVVYHAAKGAHLVS